MRGTQAYSSMSFFEAETDTEPKDFFRFLTKDCFKLKK